MLNYRNNFLVDSEGSFNIVGHGQGRIDGTTGLNFFVILHLFRNLF